MATCVVALAAVALITFFQTRAAHERHANRLLDHAARVSESISVSRLREIIQPNHPSAPAAAERLRNYLTRMRDFEEDCTRIELVAFDGAEIRMRVESGQPRHAGASTFTYDALVSQFERAPNAVLEDRTPDPNLVTVTVPILDPRTDRLLAAYRLEFDRSGFKRAIWRAGRPALFFATALFVLSGIVAVLIALRASGSIRAGGWSSYLEPAYAVTAGLLLTAYLAVMAHQERYDHLREKFEQLAHSATATIMQRMEHIRDTHLMALTRFFESSEDVTSDEFIRFTEPLLDDRAIYAWAWVPRVLSSDRDAFEQKLRALYPGLSNIWERAEDGGRKPAADRASYAPLLFASPLDVNRDAIGFDQASEPRRRAALLQAERTGLPTATPPLELVHRTDVGPVMIIYNPTRRPDGHVAFLLEMRNIMPMSSGTTPLRFDCLLTSPDGHSELLASTLDHPVPDGTPTLARPVAAFGFLFRIVAYPDVMMLTREPQQVSAVVGASGVLLTLAITIMVGTPIQRRRELEAEVHRRTVELRQKENLYRTLTESMRDVVWIADAETQRYTYVSPSSFRLDGVKAEECVGEPLDQTVRPEDRAEVRRMVESLTADFKSGRIRPSEYITKELALMHKDGHTICTEVIASFHVNPDSGHAEIWGVTRDISERKRALDALQENRRFLREIIEHSGALIFVKDLQGVYRLVNAQWERVLGLTRDNVLGRTDSDVFPRDVAERFRQQDQEVCQSGSSLEAEDVLTTPSGTHYFITIKFPLRDANGNVTGLCGMSLETTMQKIAEDRVRAHLEELQRLHAVTIGRESRVLELKREINALRARLGDPPKYGDID